MNQAIRVSISDVDMPAYGAYLAPSAREGKAQILLNFSLIYATADSIGENPAAIAAEVAVHELLHALQDVFGRLFSESDVEKLSAAAQGVEVEEGYFKDFDAYAEGLSMGQELLHALQNAWATLSYMPCRCTANFVCERCQSFNEADALLKRILGDDWFAKGCEDLEP